MTGFMKHAALSFMVWNMRWMTRYLGPLARLFIMWYAEKEVVACGYREKNGDVFIMYSPYPLHSGHAVHEKTPKGWRRVEAVRERDYAAGVVRRLRVPRAQSGVAAVLRVTARRARGLFVRHSPLIVIEDKTVYDNALLVIEKERDGGVEFSWPRARKFKPLIYFLLVSRGNDHVLSAIYTREEKWTCPYVYKASLSLKEPLERLAPGVRYRVRLVVVGYDGWVPAIAEREFTY